MQIRTKLKYNIEEEIAVAYLLIGRIRIRRKRRRVSRIFQEREEKGFSWCFIFLDITIVGFTHDFLLIFLSHFLILFIKAQSTNL